MLDAITPTRAKIRLLVANLTSRPSQWAGPFSLGEGMFILPITPTPLDKFPAPLHGRRGLWSGTNVKPNQEDTHEKNDAKTIMQRIGTVSSRVGEIQSLSCLPDS